MALRQRLLKSTRDRRKRQNGQSIMEFALLIPLYLGLMIYLIQATIAVNGGIAYQKYAREKLFELLWNHRDYPKLLTTTKTNENNVQKGWQRTWVGVDDKTWRSDEQGERDTLTEVAPKVIAGYSEAVANQDTSNEGFPATTRKSIRIRVKVFICLGPKFFPRGRNDRGGSQDPPYLSDIGSMNDSTFRDGGTFRLCSDEDS